MIKCQANCSDFTVDSSITLNINYAPRFLTGSTKNVITYGSKVRLDCSTIENPEKNLLKWKKKIQNSFPTYVVHNHGFEKYTENLIVPFLTMYI